MSTKDAANPTESPDTRAPSRRDALKSLGLITGAAVASALVARSAEAQTATMAKPAALDLDRASLAELKGAVVRANRLPTTTPIAEMRLSREQLSRLTPAAQKLTKADLIALGQIDQGLNPNLSPAAESLTIKDIRSIRGVFTTVAGQAPGAAAAGDVSCCCCTPCCCAAAVVTPERPIA